MYADRETGGLGKGEIVEAKAVQGGRDQQELKGQPTVTAPVRLPARIAIEMTSSQPRRRSPKARRLALIGAALLLAVRSGGTFRYHLWTGGPLNVTPAPYSMSPPNTPHPTTIDHTLY